jgi:hypothetical protein
MSDVKVTADLQTDIPGFDLANLDKPTLHALSYSLRHPDTWPEGFVWNYNNCHKCAMGLAHQLWAQVPETDVHDGISVMARTFAMSYTAARRVFFKAGVRLCGIPIHLPHSLVTPEMVANEIDRYLATAE